MRCARLHSEVLGRLTLTATRLTIVFLLSGSDVMAASVTKVLMMVVEPRRLIG